MTTAERLSVVVQADWVAGPQQGQWTYEDYAAIPEDGHRYEVVNGVLYMSPSPGVPHQGSVARFVHYLFAHVELAGLGRVFSGPLDVELSDKNVVQPDVLVVLKQHRDRIRKTRIIGAPDLVIEIASPSTARHDQRAKLDAYAGAGVPEYWVIDPDAQTVKLLILKNGVYCSRGAFSGQAVLPSQVVPELPVRVEQFFSEE
ncbi:MAG TPA: Uma2 family endonuclease [Ktedonobacteraceae bacterium]|nr:Uma2 family endonuclease [Ktedonobacteraceae bacterium]